VYVSRYWLWKGLFLVEEFGWHALVPFIATAGFLLLRISPVEASVSRKRLAAAASWVGFPTKPACIFTALPCFIWRYY
jgi:hypothetical protein